MDKTEQDQWLSKDIPHRLRACLAGLRLQEERMPQTADEAKRLIIRDWFLRTAAFEGRMVATRWLIEFIGVGGRNKDGTISPPRRKPNDVSIKMIEGGKEIELDSRTPKFWQRCGRDAHRQADMLHGIQIIHALTNQR